MQTLCIMPKKPVDEGVLVAAAKTIGKAAGTVAALAGIEPAAQGKASATAKLPKKNKTRLPRRQKKAQRRAATTL